MIDLRKEFPVLENHLYFDTPSSGLMYDSLAKWRTQHDHDFLLKGSVFRHSHQVFLQSVKEKMGAFFNASAKSIALIPNFSFGLNCLLEALESPRKILLVRNDYPSIVWPVVHRKHQIAFAEANEFFEETIEEAVKNFKPDVFIFSIVQYINGIKVDFEYLKNLKQNHPKLLLIADGTQYFGTEQFDFEGSAFDAVMGSGYKWLLAGYGNGFLIAKESLKEVFFPKTKGFNSTDYIEDFDGEVPFVKHFEPGHQDTFNYGSLGFSIDFLNTVGIKKIEAQIIRLTNKAQEIFLESDLLDEAVVKRKNNTPIFNIKGNEKLYRELQSNRVVCIPRGEGIRLGFHFYNTEEELDELSAILKKLR